MVFKRPFEVLVISFIRAHPSGLRFFLNPFYKLKCFSKKPSLKAILMGLQCCVFIASILFIAGLIGYRFLLC